MGFRGAGEWKFPLIENWGGGKMAALKTPPPGTAVCPKLISGSSSSPPEGCLIRCFGLPRLLSLEGGTDLWYTE